MAIQDEEERDLIDVTDDDMKPGTPLWRSSPEELWLAVGDEPEDWLYELADCVDVTWAADFCPVAVGVGYVRADLHHSLSARVAELEARIAEAEKQEPSLPNSVANAVRVLRLHNHWRRGEGISPCSPEELGRVIDTICDHVSHTWKPDVLAAATDYALTIVESLHRLHYSDNTAFEPFGDLLGLLSQIDNMVCGWDSHPLPAPVAADVESICNAYESGVGHRRRPTAKVNPYKEGTHEHAAYALGASGDEQIAPVAEVPDDVVRDAERYRWLRDYATEHLYGDELITLFDRHYSAFDAGIDAAMLAAKAKGE